MREADGGAGMIALPRISGRLARKVPHDRSLTVAARQVAVAKSQLHIACILLLVALPLLAAVDGTVTNKSTGKPQAGATVTLYKLGGSGMEAAESVKSDAQGKFSMSQQTPQGPHLIQTAFDGVTYNHMLPPGTPATGLELEVYNASKKQGDAKVAQHIILFEPTGSELAVTESIIYGNEGKLTYYDADNGTVRFYVPPTLKGKVRVTCKAPQGMPIERAPEPTKELNVYSVAFPIKPGETQFQIQYLVPMPDPPVFASRILHKEGRVRLVTPRGATLQGDNLTELGTEPTTQAMLYELKDVKDYKVSIAGTGSISAGTGGGGNAEDEGPSIQQIPARIYNRMYLVLGLVGGILVLTLVMFYRKAPATADPSKGKRRA
jgi:hypothetical protein